MPNHPLINWQLNNGWNEAVWATATHTQPEAAELPEATGISVAVETYTLAEDGKARRLGTDKWRITHTRSQTTETATFNYTAVHSSIDGARSINLGENLTNERIIETFTQLLEDTYNATEKRFLPGFGALFTTKGYQQANIVAAVKENNMTGLYSILGSQEHYVTTLGGKMTLFNATGGDVENNVGSILTSNLNLPLNDATDNMPLIFNTAAPQKTLSLKNYAFFWQEKNTNKWGHNLDKLIERALKPEFSASQEDVKKFAQDILIVAENFPA